MFEISTGFIAECVYFSGTCNSQWCLTLDKWWKKEWVKYCTNWLCSVYTWRHNNDINFIKISFQHICPSILVTKSIFWIFHILKINRIMPFCNLFMERPSYVIRLCDSVWVVGWRMWYCLDCATCVCVMHMLMCSQQDNDVSQAMAASLATFFKQIGLTDTAGILDSCVSFHTRDKRASWLKSSRKVC